MSSHRLAIAKQLELLNELVPKEKMNEEKEQDLPALNEQNSFLEVQGKI